MTTKRKIINIDKSKCNGCGLCVSACHEGAIVMVDGRAELVSESYCDGLGDCLAPCPTGALSIVTREAEPFDEKAVQERMASQNRTGQKDLTAFGGCPGMAAHSLGRPAKSGDSRQPAEGGSAREPGPGMSELANWPVQLRLVPPTAPYLRGADILLAADCTGFAVSDLHAAYVRGRALIIACPKLDDAEAGIQKLADILRTSSPKCLTVLRMEVPCCGGIVRMAEEAVTRSGLSIPVITTTVGINGQPLPELNA